MLQPILYSDKKKKIENYEYLEDGIIKNRVIDDKTYHKYITIASHQNYHSLEGKPCVKINGYSHARLINNIKSLEKNEWINYVPFIQKDVKTKILYDIIDELIEYTCNLEQINLQTNKSQTNKSQHINKLNYNDNYESDTENVIEEVHQLAKNIKTDINKLINRVSTNKISTNKISTNKAIQSK